MTEHKDALYSRTANALDELRDWAKENPDSDEPHDAIADLADAAVPVYNSELLEIALMHHHIALNVPDIGPAFDGTHTPINIIAANIYEHITEALWGEWEKIRREQNQDQGDLLTEEKE